ncbi:MAG TPA: HAMP domain-containing sensor histidine kinase [Gallionella sp.]|nr:HAMP domain-containing sensor histidine kinase [Gallionella sp.]
MFNIHNYRIASQPFSRVRQFLLTLSLQRRFLLIMGASSLFFTVLIWTMFDNFTGQFVERFGARFAEKQMLYDKARTLQPLIQEIALVKQSADSDLLRKWANNEQDAKLLQHAMTKMENLRKHFHGGNYFIALVKSGNFYYNDAEGQYEGRQLRYTLDPALPDDAWFFDFIRSGADYRIRAATNAKLGVSKIWIRVPIWENGKVIGVLGSGIDLDQFAQNVSNTYQPGVTNMFINHNAVIQIYNDVGHVDFPGVLNSSDHEHTTSQILDASTGKQWVPQAIRKLDVDPYGIQTGFVLIQGKRYLAGLIELHEVDWYDLTLLDMSILLPQSNFMKMWLVFIVGPLGLLAILAFFLQRLVLKPVVALTDAVARIRRGDYRQEPMEAGGGEVRKLAAQFQDMAEAIHNTQYWLEEEIEKRTRQLVDARDMLKISLQHERDGRETQTNLLALMAHEMRSPVAVIGNTAQMLSVLAQSNQPDFLPRIEKIMHSVRQLATLMDNFLAEKWLDMGKHGLDRAAGDLNQLCAEIAENFIESHVRPIRFEPFHGDARFCADWQLIRIAVMNLLDNASKYSSLNDEINLKILSCKAGMLCVEVSDHGIGIPVEIQTHIFDKFVRGKKENDIQGNGLGLYLVNWIARFHGGHTEISSIEGQGSVFRLCLPACKPESIAPSGSAQHATQAAY